MNLPCLQAIFSECIPRYAERRGWQVEIISQSLSDIGDTRRLSLKSLVKELIHGLNLSLVAIASSVSL